MTPRPGVVITSSGYCGRCGHLATLTGEPWDNQYRCIQGCRCTMQGCCPVETPTGAAT